MERKVYFGNATKQLWIPAPRTGLNASSAGYFSDSQLLSGRAFIKRSKASHRRFSPAWVGPLNASSVNDSLHTVKDYFDGIYGDGPFYWLDPFAVDSNLLAPNWASPMLTENGWASISSVGAASLVDTEANTRNYPYKSLRLTFSGSVQESAEYFRIIIPTDYRLHFGWHGEQNSGDATVILRCYDRDTGATTDVVTEPLSVTSIIRTNSQVRGRDYSMVDVIIKNPSASASVIDIAGMIAQVLPDLSTVEQGDFISGRGTRGLLFSSAPTITYVSAKINDGYVEVATDFIEE
jgi:hypothetical protein